MNPKRRQDVSWKKLGGGGMLLDLSSGAYFELDEFGMAIWMRLDGRTAAPAIARALAARYKARLRTVQTDVTGFLAILRKRRLLAPDTRRTR